MTTDPWLLFLPQLPAAPSSLRVLVWRRLRGAGATTLQNGVWVLPNTPAQARFLHDLVGEVRGQGGAGVILTAAVVGEAEPGIVVERFQTDRNQEYREFGGQCRDFLAEIAAETASRNFTFAELEENEHELQKLASWLAKIQARDFFPGLAGEQTVAALGECQAVFQRFTGAVYAEAGLVGGEPANAPAS